jgi:hypothetical protein
MTCIPKLLELKGEQKFLLISLNAVVEGGGKYKGYDYIVTLTRRGHRCGYVAVSASAFPVPEGYLSDHEGRFSVHGGITFWDKPAGLVDPELHKFLCDDVWIGFDAAHGADARDMIATKEAFPDNYSTDAYFSSDDPKLPMIKQICDMMEMVNSFGEDIPGTTVRSYDYMGNECKSLIDQIVEVAAA